jgi:succinate dehydrogenase / fumarate reductase cytochrome b subunit
MSSLVLPLVRFYRSTIGAKILVALTGAVMVLFLIGHLIGNLLVFLGPDALNSYAKKLSDLGPLLWVVRIGLLVAVVVHIAGTVRLKLESTAARSRPYQVTATRAATRSGRTMIWSGLTILAFVLYHLAHFTWGVANDYYNPENKRYWLPDGGHNVYNMVVDGFRWVPASLFYIVAMGLLFMHLSHGFASIFQTLGLTTPKSRPAIELTGKVLSIALFAGNCLMPLAIMTGITG